jgi:glycine cleavage system aminomethyltransferase T
MEETNTTSTHLPEITDSGVSPSQEKPTVIGLSNLSLVESELNTLYTGVGMRDLSSLGLIELKGNDSLDFLHRISTNSIKNIVKGEIAKTIFTTEKGRIIDTAVIINLDEYQLLVCSRDHHEKMMIWLQKYVISDDVKLNNINGKYTLLEILGPQADSFMTLINGNIVNNIQPNTIKIINTDGIIFFLMKHYDHNGHLIYWILADPIYAQKLIRYIVENRGPFDFNLIGEETYNYYRVENGIPIAPSEINDLHTPHDVGLMNPMLKQEILRQQFIRINSKSL